MTTQLDFIISIKLTRIVLFLYRAFSFRPPVVINRANIFTIRVRCFLANGGSHKLEQRNLINAFWNDLSPAIKSVNFDNNFNPAYILPISPAFLSHSNVGLFDPFIFRPSFYGVIVARLTSMSTFSFLNIKSPRLAAAGSDSTLTYVKGCVDEMNRVPNIKYRKRQHFNARPILRRNFTTIFILLIFFIIAGRIFRCEMNLIWFFYLFQSRLVD